MTQTLLLPVRTTTESNAKEHWRVKHARSTNQKHTTTLLLSQLARPSLPCVVTLTRLSAGEMDDDNLASSQKHVRDAIAAWLGVDDKHRHIVAYEYRQERCKRGQFGTRVEIRSIKQEVA